MHFIVRFTTGNMGLIDAPPKTFARFVGCYFKPSMWPFTIGKVTGKSFGLEGRELAHVF